MSSDRRIYVTAPAPDTDHYPMQSRVSSAQAQAVSGPIMDGIFAGLMPLMLPCHIPLYIINTIREIPSVTVCFGLPRDIHTLIIKP